MRRGPVAFAALAILCLALFGCGRMFVEREPWRLQAEEACLAGKRVPATAYMSRLSEIDGPGTCGITYPFRVSALSGGTVSLKSRLTLACPIIPQVDGWLDDTVQPAAELYLGSRVAEIRAGSYSCRGRNNQPGARVSEHAYGNAVDVMSFRLADGREISVEHGWRGRPDEQGFLREVFVGACRHFTTVLAPGSDVFHYNHLHLDLARHDPRWSRHICKPVIKFEPRIDPDREPARPGLPTTAATAPRAPIAPAATDTRPSDPDEEDDGAAPQAPTPPVRPLQLHGPLSIGSGLY